MEIVVQRDLESSEWTRGKLFIDGVFECFTLEDQYQQKKVKKETRIPAGRYKILLRIVGTHHDRYKVKFPGIHQGMLHLQDVPEFQFILIHIGNTDADSEGCLLVGSSFMNGKLVGSTIAYEKLYKKVVKAAEKGELWITIKDKK